MKKIRMNKEYKIYQPVILGTYCDILFVMFDKNQFVAFSDNNYADVKTEYRFRSFVSINQLATWIDSNRLDYLWQP